MEHAACGVRANRMCEAQSNPFRKRNQQKQLIDEFVMNEIFFCEFFCLLGWVVRKSREPWRILENFQKKNHIILQHHAIFYFPFRFVAPSVFSPGSTTIWFSFMLHFYNFIFAMPVSFFTFSTLSALWSRNIPANSVFDLVYGVLVNSVQCIKRKLYYPIIEIFIEEQCVQCARSKCLDISMILMALISSKQNREEMKIGK